MFLHLTPQFSLFYKYIFVMVAASILFITKKILLTYKPRKKKTLDIRFWLSQNKIVSIGMWYYFVSLSYQFTTQPV